MLQPMMSPQEQHVVWTERGAKRIRVKSELSKEFVAQLGFSFTFVEYNQLNKTIAVRTAISPKQNPQNHLLAILGNFIYTQIYPPHLRRALSIGRD